VALRLPILDYEAWHPDKLSRIVSHEHGSHGKGVAGKKYVVRTDWLGIWTHCLQGSTNFCRSLCCMLVEIFNCRNCIP